MDRHTRGNFEKMYFIIWVKLPLTDVVFSEKNVYSVHFLNIAPIYSMTAIMRKHFPSRVLIHPVLCTFKGYMDFTYSVLNVIQLGNFTNFLQL